MYHHSRRYRRLQRQRAIKRKKGILQQYGSYSWVHYDGMLSKGKVHCSCPMCRKKSYDHPKIQDVRNKQKGLGDY